MNIQINHVQIKDEQNSDTEYEATRDHKQEGTKKNHGHRHNRDTDAGRTGYSGEAAQRTILLALRHITTSSFGPS